MTKQKKNKPIRGKFVSGKSPAVLKKAQKLRLIFMYCSTLTLAVILFIPQEWAAFTKEIIWLQSSYVLLIALLVVVSVIASYGASRKCKITDEIDEKYKPKRGFEKRTFASAEWFMNLHFLLAAAQLALCIYGIVSYGFGWGDILTAFLACSGAVLAFMFRLVTFRALKDDLTYVPPPQQKTANEPIIENNGSIA